MSKDLISRLNNLHHQADWIGIREVKETTKHCLARNGNFDQNTTVIDHGFMVEVLVDGNFAYCGTNSISAQSLQDACDRATYLAKLMASWKLFPFTADNRPLTL